MGSCGNAVRGKEPREEELGIGLGKRSPEALGGDGVKPNRSEDGSDGISERGDRSRLGKRLCSLGVSSIRGTGSLVSSSGMEEELGSSGKKAKRMP